VCNFKGIFVGKEKREVSCKETRICVVVNYYSLDDARFNECYVCLCERQAMMEQLTMKIVELNDQQMVKDQTIAKLQ